MEAPISTVKSGSIGRLIVCVFLFLATIVLLGAEIARAQTPAINRAKSEVEALRERIDELEEQLSTVVEEYNYANAKLEETKAAAEKTQADLTRTERDLDTAQARLNDRVVQIYKQGSVGLLGVLADASSLTELVTRMDLLERVGAQDAQLVEDVQAHRTAVAERKEELAARLQEEQALVAEVEAARVAVNKRLADNEKALEGKEALLERLQREEAVRQARLAAAAREAAERARIARAEAAERARVARAEAAARARAAAEDRANDGVAVPDSADAGVVVDIAMRYLGRPYVWAGSSPSGFDCSGFVKYVFAKVGINLPHSSRMQIGRGQPVSRENLRPGDLVFFGRPRINHVAIYIGDDRMIHAAGVGRGVRIDDVWRSNYVGACRIIP